MHNRSPDTIAIDANGPIRRPADLVGHKLFSHPEDASWKLFPEHCAATGLNMAAVSDRI